MEVVDGEGVVLVLTGRVAGEGSGREPGGPEGPRHVWAVNANATNRRTSTLGCHAEPVTVARSGADMVPKVLPDDAGPWHIPASGLAPDPAVVRPGHDHHPWDRPDTGQGQQIQDDLGDQLVSALSRSAGPFAQRESVSGRPLGSSIRAWHHAARRQQVPSQRLSPHRASLVHQLPGRPSPGSSG